MFEPKMITDKYLAVWNEENGSHRRALLAEGWAECARYVDPLMSGQGREAIATMIEGARGQFAGHRFELVGTPDGHGEHVRFSWTLVASNGPAIGSGTDFVRLDERGRIAEVVGFLNGVAA